MTPAPARSYRRRASARAAGCTVAVTCISAGTSVMVMAASSSAGLDWPAVAGSVACVATGFLLLFLGDCRELRPD